MKKTKKELFLTFFLKAMEKEVRFFAVKIKSNSPKEEIIINFNNSFSTKYDYYNQAYNDNLELKSNNLIKIIDWEYGDLEDINSFIEDEV